MAIKRNRTNVGPTTQVLLRLSDDATNLLDTMYPNKSRPAQIEQTVNTAHEVHKVLQDALEVMKHYPGVCTTNDWTDIWHEVCQPLELIIRKALREHGHEVEPWAILETE